MNFNCFVFFFCKKNRKGTEMEARMVQPLDYCPYTTSPFSYSYGDSISFYNTPAHTISFFNHNEIQPAEQELEDYFSVVIKSKFLFFIPSFISFRNQF